jgi:hypothetical protein
MGSVAGEERLFHAKIARIREGREGNARVPALPQSGFELLVY